MRQLPYRPAPRIATSFAVAALVALGVGLGAALPAAAEVFHIDLANGETFDSLYRPEEASWDADLLLLLTDSGSWIALPKADVVSIISETESSGYGRVIDTSTIVLGYATNDAPLPDDPTQFSTVDALQQLFEQQNQGQDYSVQQFVEPGQAGGGTGGLPAYGATAPQGFSYINGNLGTLPGSAVPGAPAPPAPAPGASGAGGAGATDQ